MPQAGFYEADAGYRVFAFPNCRNVYLYENTHGGPKVVGKFFPFQGNHSARCPGEIEFNNLSFIRSLGFCNPPYLIVRPFGFHPGIGQVLILEYLEMQTAGSVILDAIYRGKNRRLYRKLTLFAAILAELHNRTAGDWTVDFDERAGHMERLLRYLVDKRGMTDSMAGMFQRFRESWRNRPEMWGDRRVVVHGDATPSNILFGRGSVVAMIDLERMKWADRTLDLGMAAAELKHFFFRATGNPQAGEPAIHHLIREYCSHFPDREAAFFSITRRLPFYMAVTLLRISRNGWVDPDYRFRLWEEACRILR